MPSRREYGSGERLDGACSIQDTGLLPGQCAFLSSGTSQSKKTGRHESIGDTGSREQHLDDKPCTETKVVLKDDNLLPWRLSPGRCFLRGILLESEAKRARVRDHSTGAPHHHLQKPARKGRSYVGSTVRHARQGERLWSLPLNFELLPIQSKRPRLAACFSQQVTARPLAGPSAGVVHVEVESLVAQQRVGVVKLEQVDAFAGVVMAASLHVPVAVPPVHRHDLPIAAPQGAP